MKKIFSILIILSFLTSCASNYRKPESIQEKMDRFQAQNAKVNHMPDYYSPTTKLLAKAKNSRTPASVGRKKRAQQADLTLSYNNKKLYFLTLYGQYSELQAYSNHTAPELKICPSFHTTFLNYKDKYNKKIMLKTPIKNITYSSKNLKDENYLALHPELALPVTSENVHPRVKDILLSQEKGVTKEVVLNAFNIHLTKTYNEIQELCEFGQSQNYFIFENLMTYINQQSNFNSTEKNMQYLMKTTLFSNMALIKSMNQFPKKKIRRGPSRKIASIQSKSDPVFSNEVIKRLNANWSHGFLDQIGEK